MDNKRPVKLPTKFVDDILTKPVPIPLVTVMLPSVKDANVTEPVPLMFKKSVAD